MRLTLLLAAAGVAALASPAFAADTIEVPISGIAANGTTWPMGKIVLEETPEGLKLTPMLAGLTPGPHGFHVHENYSCDPGPNNGTTEAGMAAGGHMDPKATGHHEGPEGKGHTGDLPVLTVEPSGLAMTAVIAPKLKFDDVIGHALVIHVGGDNYADEPLPLGGGGARIACGLVSLGTAGASGGTRLPPTTTP